MARQVRRGEIYWVDWNPGRGSEQLGVRPSLVIQNDVGNAFGVNTIVATITTPIGRMYDFQVVIEPADSGLPRTSLIDLAQIMTIDKGRLKEKCGQLSPAKMAQVDRAIMVSLGLG